MSYNETIPYAKKYQAYAEAGLKVLARESATLAADVRAGDLAAAKRDWLTAHLQYQTLGAAYGTFGDYDGEIDGDANAAGTASPDWTGFYRLEYGLWHGQGAGRSPGGQPAPEERERAARLVAAHGRYDCSTSACAPTRSWRTPCSSSSPGTTTTAAAPRWRPPWRTSPAPASCCTLLHPLLAPRYAGLPAVYSWLDRLQSLLEKQHRPNGTWVPVAALPARARQQIDAACEPRCSRSRRSRRSPSRGTR